KGGCRLAHVEAGLRSRDWSMPEEINRVVTDRLSDVLLAPSQDGVDNLLAEGVAADRIHLVGNVMVDTLMANLDRARALRMPQRLGLEPGRFGLVTLHRPSTVDQPDVLEGIFRALGEIGEEVPLVLPAHPRLRQRVAGTDLPPGLRMMDPASYLEFI